jgi:hypothetical protein
MPVTARRPFCSICWRLGVPDVHSSQRVQERRLADGRMLKVNLDGSAAWQGQSANALLDQFFQPCHDLDFDGAARHPRILAINSGKLLEWLETQEDTRSANNSTLPCSRAKTKINR